MVYKTLSRLLYLGCVIALSAVAIHAQGEFVYINHSSVPNRVSAFRVETNGALSEIAGSPFFTGGLGRFDKFSSTVVSRTRNLLFAANTVDSSVSVFSINPVVGTLTLVPGSPFLVQGIENMKLALSANDDFLFAGYNISQGLLRSAVQSFRIDSIGALAPVPGSEIVVGRTISDLKVSNDGRFLFLLDERSRFVRVVSIGSEGLLTQLPGVEFGGTPGFLSSFEINCRGDSAYVIEGFSRVHVFDVDSNAVFTPVPQSPFGFFGSELALLSANGRFLFVGGSHEDPISHNFVGEMRVHNTDRTANLSMISGSPFTIGLGLNPQDLATNRAGSFLYVVSSLGGLTVFGVADNGVLALASQYSFPSRWSRFATLAAYPPKSCGPIFDLCIQDDSNGTIFKLNSTTGEYELTNCGGLVTSGLGVLTRRGCLITLEHNASDRRILARIETCQNRATANVQLLPQGRTFVVTDRNTLNNSCSCR